MNVKFGLAALEPGSSGYCSLLPNLASQGPEKNTTVAGNSPVTTTHFDHIEAECICQRKVRESVMQTLSPTHLQQYGCFPHPSFTPGG